MISIIVPVIRPENTKRLFEAIDKHSDGIRYEIVTDEDTERIGCPRMVEKLVVRTNYDWVMFLGDDTIPQFGFMSEAVKQIDNLSCGWGMIGLNDQLWDGNIVATHWLCHKNVLDLTGGQFFHTGYRHTMCDRELTDIAQEHGCYIWATEAKIEHLNGQINKEVEQDEILKEVYSDDNQRADTLLYLKRKEERIGYKLAVGIPITDDKVDTLFLYSMMLMDFPEYNLYYPKFQYHVGDLARCRNDIARRALKDGCTHLLFMDTDQVYHDQSLVKDLLAHKKDIVGAKVHRRWPPFEPILQRDGNHVPDEEIYQGGLVEVDSTGCGCLMIRTSVFADLEYPWFKIERDDDDEEVVCGEDVHFCRKAKRAGYQVFVDCDANVGHLTTMEVNTSFYKLLQEVAHYNTSVKEKRHGRKKRKGL